MKKTKLFILVCIVISSTLYLYSQAAGGESRYSNPLEILSVIIWLAYGIFFTAIGTFLILFGQTSLVLREIAFNSRKETEDDANKKKEQYNAIPTLVCFASLGIGHEVQKLSIIFNSKEVFCG
jgi:hypothetical protein